MSADWIKNYEVEQENLTELDTGALSNILSSLATVFFWFVVFVLLYLAS